MYNIDFWVREITMQILPASSKIERTCSSEACKFPHDSPHRKYHPRNPETRISGVVPSTALRIGPGGNTSWIIGSSGNSDLHLRNDGVDLLHSLRKGPQCLRSVSAWISTYHGCMNFRQCPGHVMEASMLLLRHKRELVVIFVEDRLKKDQRTTQARRAAGILLVLCQECLESIRKSSCARSCLIYDCIRELTWSVATMKCSSFHHDAYHQHGYPHNHGWQRNHAGLEYIKNLRLRNVLSLKSYFVTFRLQHQS